MKIFKRKKSKVDGKLIAELRAKNTILEETLRKERDMLDILGHELRTPLTIAKNSIILLRQKYIQKRLIEKELGKYLDMAHENLDREATLLETLLSTTKIDNKKMDLNKEKVDFTDVVNDSLDGLREKAEKKGLKVKWESPEITYIVADRERVQEVVDNIIDNAIKYTHKGTIEILMKPVTGYVELSIKDSGVGISKEDLKKLGQKFYRTDTYLKSSKEVGMDIVRPGGTGLGLYVSFELVKKLEGKIDVQSELGNGSVFTISMPIFREGQNIKESGSTGLKKMSVYERFEKMKQERRPQAV